MVNTSFNLESFRDTFRDGYTWSEPEMGDGFSRVAAGSQYVKLEFTLDGREELMRASLLFPYFLKDANANRVVTAQVIRFLEVCLPSNVLPEDWIQNATRELKQSDEKHFGSEHLDIVISLTQLKPSLTFLLLAERKGAVKATAFSA